MKKFVRFTLVLVIILAAAIVILGVVEPTNVPIMRTIVIKAPKNEVFEQIVKLKNWPTWAPWFRLDSAIKTTYSGTDGEPGSSFSWVGNDKVGAGEIRDSAINGTQMLYVLNVLKPYKNSACGYLKAEDTAGMVKVTWTITAHTPFPLNAMNAFVNIDKLLGGDFESGLSNMKQYVESHAVAASDIEIKEVDYPAHIYEGVRKMMSWDEMPAFFKDNYGLLGKDIGGKINGPATGLYYEWDTINKRTDMAAVFPVSDTAMPVKGTAFMYAGPAKAVMAVQRGGYSTSMKYHNAITAYMKAKGEAHGLVIEEYIAGAPAEPDSNKWVTNIYYLVK